MEMGSPTNLLALNHHYNSSTPLHYLSFLPKFQPQVIPSQRFDPISSSRNPSPTSSSRNPSPTSSDPVPRLAYLISVSNRDGPALKRTLLALYHPRNQCVVHLDLEASTAESMELFEFVRRDEILVKMGNVRMVVSANLETYRGPTMASNTLHAATVLLRVGGEWDWFVNLSASDYQLVTQDDLLHALSSVPREKNFHRAYK